MKDSSPILREVNLEAGLWPYLPWDIQVRDDWDFIDLIYWGMVEDNEQ